jgi:hypothetical protein
MKKTQERPSYSPYNEIWFMVVAFALALISVFQGR